MIHKQYNMEISNTEKKPPLLSEDNREIIIMCKFVQHIQKTLNSLTLSTLTLSRAII